ncbi:uncharacterized protein BXZ73DRAFT_91104 [Epithele typhae]|uniref:uncharacterized protein n=1 Tax=Epithele typhae TaxID=378194 RepID=UPI00200826E7|nr:uncharacterized protein BXZ73DRAFT_91104 [Epithele typhae]KAH9925369.1 hypothetical protein BXZ73DRAFT_91104 [Epithele typhae]
MELKHISPEDVEFFMMHGYLVVKNAFSRAQAQEFTKDLWVRLGMDPEDPSTWDKERVHMPARRQVAVKDFAPKAWNAMTDLLGGEDRIDPAASAWGDSFIVNLGVPASAPPGAASAFGSTDPTPAHLANWHVDGDFFVHFLDSPEQALLVVPLFSDVRPDGGATYIAPDGLAPVARYLAAHPEGVVPLRLSFVPADSPALLPGASTASTMKPEDDPGFRSHPAEARKCREFVALTGDVGDVVLLHPLTLHSASPNVLGVPRVITNPPVALREPFAFDRADPGEFSVVERATLRALGVDRLEYGRTGARRRVVPPRLAVQAKLAEEEARRLEDMEQKRAQAGATNGGVPQTVAVA